MRRLWPSLPASQYPRPSPILTFIYLSFIIYSPSNPSGSNWTREHLIGIAQIAERKHVPIIADEVYAHMSWSTPLSPTGLFTPMSSVSGSVPVFTLCGLSKRFLAPGWRTGWIVVCDPMGYANQVREGLERWGNRIQGPNGLVQM